MRFLLHRHSSEDRWYVVPEDRLDEFCRLFVAGMPEEPAWLTPLSAHYSFVRFEAPEFVFTEDRERFAAALRCLKS